MRRLVPIVIGVLSVVFLPALGGEFLTWDDDINFLSNESYRGLGWSQIRWAFSNVRMGHYIPSPGSASPRITSRGHEPVGLSPGQPARSCCERDPILSGRATPARGRP